MHLLNSAASKLRKSMTSNIPCPFLNCLIQKERRELLQHMKLHHSRNELILKCKIDSCNQLCTSIGSYEKHLVRWHAVTVNDLTNTGDCDDMTDVSQNHLDAANCVSDNEDKKTMDFSVIQMFCQVMLLNILVILQRKWFVFALS